VDFKKQEFVGFVISLYFFWLQFGYWEKINFCFHFFINCHKEFTVLIYFLVQKDNFERFYALVH